MHCTDINEGFEGMVGWDTGYAGELLDFAQVRRHERGTIPPPRVPRATCSRRARPLQPWARALRVRKTSLSHAHSARR